MSGHRKWSEIRHKSDQTKRTGLLDELRDAYACSCANPAYSNANAWPEIEAAAALIAALEAERDTVAGYNSELVQDAARLSIALGDAEGWLEEAQEQRDAARADVTRLKAEVEMLESDHYLDEARRERDEMAALGADYCRRWDKEVEDLINERDELQAEASDLRAENERLEALLAEIADCWHPDRLDAAHPFFVQVPEATWDRVRRLAHQDQEPTP